MYANIVTMWPKAKMSLYREPKVNSVPFNVLVHTSLTKKADVSDARNEIFFYTALHCRHILCVILGT